MHLKINWVTHVQHIRGLTFFLFFRCVLVSLDMCCGSASGSESDGTIASSSGSRSYCLPPLPTKHSMARCPASMKCYNTTCVNIYPPCLHTNIKVSWRKVGGGGGKPPEGNIQTITHESSNNILSQQEREKRRRRRERERDRQKRHGTRQNQEWAISSCCFFSLNFRWCWGGKHTRKNLCHERLWEAICTEIFWSVSVGNWFLCLF